ncbi:RNA polymerase factor sigma-54 [Niveibacterium umoris]|uniref:RNA polymerase sigma-54 factor n=1 Tax=Niveibacterium umoris TaxID=1193620 RepID=A0A840BLF4_9RHOO|nr:RNA polymerase factor sigma-54 [Niveibacterium umoris]MBB4013840.1 RNA polymerase sigma-54 factor [Niveibacterium umoris]
MKPSLQLRISQQLALTPQLQQSIKLLQLSTLELNSEIERMLLENPLLEREDSESDPEAWGQSAAAPSSGEQGDAPAEGGDTDFSDAPAEPPEPSFEEGGSYDEGSAEWSGEGGGGGSGSGNRDDDEETDFQEFRAAQTSLRDHLDGQIALMLLSERDRALLRFMIEALDDDGYLTQPLDELMELLPTESEVEIEELQIALAHLQNLDPPGVGARSPGECLKLQLRLLPASAARDAAITIVEHHLELLAARDFVRLKRQLGCNEETLREAHQLVCSLDPRPGAKFAALETRYVIPDVIVRKVRGHWSATLNPDAMPKLRINQLYAGILQQHRGSAGSLAGQLQEARWMIKNVQQRFDTILRVSQAIVDRQRQFFDYGDVAMRPLTLREIAEQLDLHESTISRVTTQKYMATPRGILELKYFFGSHVATDSGGACSATAIRALIRQLVAAEDRKKPLSDARIAELLGQQGIVVARRTIAKYRESLNIPPVSQRKMI